MQPLRRHHEPGRHLRARARHARSHRQPPLPGIFPDYGAPIVREGKDGRELVLARWGMPSTVFALKGKKVDAGVTNVRRTDSPHWRRWLNPESRCLVPFTSFSEKELSPGGSRQPIWFAFDEERPLAFFAGIWTRWTSIRKVKEREVTADLFGFLTTDPNPEVGVVHPQAMPAMLTTEERGRSGFGRLGTKRRRCNGPGRPHAPTPLPLFSGLLDQPDDAATVAMVENRPES